MIFWLHYTGSKEMEIGSEMGWRATSIAGIQLQWKEPKQMDCHY